MSGLWAEARSYSENLNWILIHFSLKGIVYPKLKLSITHPHVIPNPKTDTEEKKLYSRSFIKLQLNH